MDMNKLSEYKDPEEVMREIQKRFPVLTYQENNDNYYTMLYYGKLPEPGVYMLVWDFIRIYYTNNAETYHYVACIGGEEPRKANKCDLLSMEQVIKLFNKDIEKSKKFKERLKIDKIKEDF